MFIGLNDGGGSKDDFVKWEIRAKDIAPILNANCVGCHKPKDIGPMSLMTYQEVRPWAKSILKNVKSGTMPPWHADEGFGPFSNDRSLTKEETNLIVRWCKQGAKEGSKQDLPPKLEYNAEGWKLGTPDYEFQLEAIEVSADGVDQFHDVVVETNFETDRWIKAIEILPEFRDVVHHVILWQRTGSQQSGQGWLAAWAAGADPNVFPEGTARTLKKGASIVVDMHFHPSGTARSERTKVGLFFAEDDEIEKELVNLWVMNDTFKIPAGDPNYEATSKYTFVEDAHILALAPHMHYRGKDFNYTAYFPDGTKQELLSVTNYDFNWQTNYEFVEPIAAPKGTRIECIAHWDNSPSNESNPDATKSVVFGPESYDEMMIGFVDYIVDEGIRPKPIADLMGPKIVELVAQFPGDIYEIVLPIEAGKMQRTALYIPRESNAGGWYVIFGGGVARAPLAQIEWQGDTFKCKALIPDNISTLEGTFDPATGKLEFTMTDKEGRSNTLEATLVKAADVGSD